MTHWMDQIGSRISASPRMYEPLFQDGWGDPELLETVESSMMTVSPPEDIDVEGSIQSESETLRTTDLRFISPERNFLPKSSEIAYARLFEPPGARSMVILFAAFNDHGYSTRRALGSRVLASGRSLLILENPYYGTRRPHPDRQPMRTVVDVLVMGFAAVREAQALAHFFAAHSVTYAGYSMGGNIAALAAATSGKAVGCCALAASHSPGPVFSQGLLSGAVAWNALGGHGRRDQLAEVLGRGSVLRYEPPAHHDRALIVGVGGDGYIPANAIHDLSRHWPQAELRWISGGHASALLANKQKLSGLIVEAADRFDTA